MAPLLLLLVFMGAGLHALLNNNASLLNNNNPIVYVVTDSPDREFLQQFAIYIGGSADAVSLRDLLDVSCRAQVLVLLDPNWKPQMRNLVKEASDRIVTSIVDNGIVVVATINGVSMLNDSLKRLGVLFIITRSCPDKLPGYDAQKYRCVEPATKAEEVRITLRGKSGDLVNNITVTIYVVKLGRGWLLVVPYNPVWAWLDTRDDLYFDLVAKSLERAVELARRSRLGRALALATLLAGSTLAAYSSLRSVMHKQHSSRSRQRSPVIILGVRVSAEDAVKHPVRKKILELIDEFGAISFNELWRLLGVAKATVAWHISVLQRLKIVNIIRYKRYAYIYVNSLYGERALMETLARRDRDFCRLVALAERGVNADEAARKLKLTPGRIIEVYALVRAHIDEAKKACTAKTPT